MPPRVNLRSSAVKRIMQEASERADPDTDGFVASPLEVSPVSSAVTRPLAALSGTRANIQSDIFEWHCTLRGVKGTEYEGGKSHLFPRVGADGRSVPSPHPPSRKLSDERARHRPPDAERAFRAGKEGVCCASAPTLHSLLYVNVSPCSSSFHWIVLTPDLYRRPNLLPRRLVAASMGRKNSHHGPARLLDSGGRGSQCNRGAGRAESRAPAASTTVSGIELPLDYEWRLL